MRVGRIAGNPDGPAGATGPMRALIREWFNHFPDCKKQTEIQRQKPDFPREIRKKS
jgi:hypothetical protein